MTQNNIGSGITTILLLITGSNITAKSKPAKNAGRVLIMHKKERMM